MDISKIKIGSNVYDIKDTWVAFAAPTSSAAGTDGYVPAPDYADVDKFFKGDGTWATPANDNTTYTFANGTNKFTVTPYINGVAGTPLEVAVTPSISNNVTKSGNLANNNIVIGASTSAVKTSGKTIATEVTNDANSLPTTAAVYSYVESLISSGIESALTSVLTYKGTVGTGGTVTALPTSNNKTGDVYVVKTAGTYDSAAMEVGDYLIYNGSSWDKVNGENQVSNKNASLANPGSSATIATVDGTNITVTTPSGWVLTDNNTTYKFTIGSTTNGDATNGVDLGTLKSETAAANGTTLSLVTTGEKATWNAKTSNTGTVTSVGTGIGLTGGAITTSGTIKANLVSETKDTAAAAAATSSTTKLYPVCADKNSKLAVKVDDMYARFTYTAATETLELSNVLAA